MKRKFASLLCVALVLCTLFGCVDKPVIRDIEDENSSVEMSVFEELWSTASRVKGVMDEEIRTQNYNKQKKYVLAYVENDKLYKENVFKTNEFVKNQKIINAADTKKKSKYSKPINVNKVSSLQEGKTYANIVCDAIKLNTAVYYGDKDDIIEKGVGTSLYFHTPGNGKIVLMDSHNNTYFKPLKNIALENVIRIDTFYGSYSYTVYDIKVMNETDLEKYMLEQLNNDNEERLILYTCYPFKATNYRKTERLVVFAK